MPCLVYMPIKSAMPNYHSKFPIAFYAHLVSFSNIRSILSNRTYTTEFVVSSHARFNIIRQHCGFICRWKASFQLIQSSYKVDIHFWCHTMKKRLAKIKNIWSGTWTRPVACKNEPCDPQRDSFNFEQVLFQSVLTWLSYQRAKSADRQTDGRTDR